MISKIVIFAAVVMAVSAQHYSHGHATSSQSIVRHDISHNQHGYNHVQPISVHAAPIAYHQPFVAIHAAPIASHAVVQHVAPVSHYATPAISLQHAPAHYSQNHYAHEQQVYNTHPRYDFEYSVSDPHTGDIKSQHEARDGDHVTGSYSLHQPDGSVRTVHYNADAHSGFNAQVENSAPSTHVQPAHYSPVIAHAHH